MSRLPSKLLSILTCFQVSVATSSIIILQNSNAISSMKPFLLLLKDFNSFNVPKGNCSYSNYILLYMDLFPPVNCELTEGRVHVLSSLWWICFLEGVFQRYKLPMLHKGTSKVLLWLYLQLGKRSHGRERNTTSLLKERKSRALVNAKYNIWRQVPMLGLNDPVQKHSSARDKVLSGVKEFMIL